LGKSVGRQTLNLLIRFVPIESTGALLAWDGSNGREQYYTKEQSHHDRL
jgi:hypothetical protein